MKHRISVRLSVFGVFLLFIVSAPSAFAQTSDQNQQPTSITELPIAKVTVAKELTTSKYTFDIHHDIPEWKAERLEERLVIHYADVQSITIDIVENSVTMNVLNTADVSTINKILRHFKYNGYEEL